VSEESVRWLETTVNLSSRKFVRKESRCELQIVTDAENDHVVNSTHTYSHKTCQIFQKNFCETLPPRAPDLTPCDFFLWGYVNEKAFVQHLPKDIDEMKLRITAAIEMIDRNMLERVWDDLVYRLDVCRVMNGAHIKHLQGV
jgi:hypothetical protein